MEKVGHWKINGISACDSELTLNVLFENEKGRMQPTVCACTQAEFERMAKAVQEKHPGAVCEWFPVMCDAPRFERCEV